MIQLGILLVLHWVMAFNTNNHTFFGLLIINVTGLMTLTISFIVAPFERNKSVRPMKKKLLSDIGNNRKKI